MLNYIRWNEANIDTVINHTIKDIAEEGIEYCELRFSIAKYLNHLPWDEATACLFVLNRIKYWSSKYNVVIGPILSLQYETAKVNSKRVSKLIHHWKVAEDVVGIDFVGAESHFDKNFLRDCFRHWRLCDKGLLIHAGETQSAENVKIAIEDLGVDRIAHGITAATEESEYILSMAKHNDVAFDVAINSNFYTGVIQVPQTAQGTAYHPVVKMIMKGCKVTLGTDDPATFNINLNDEYKALELLLHDHSKLTKFEIDNTIEEIKENSVEYALMKIGEYKKWDHNLNVDDGLNV